MKQFFLKKGSSLLLTLSPAPAICSSHGSTLAHRIPRRLLPCHEPGTRSEEHTSELQSQSNLVCRLLLEKKIGIIQNLLKHRQLFAHHDESYTWSLTMYRILMAFLCEIFFLLEPGTLAYPIFPLTAFIAV